MPEKQFVAPPAIRGFCGTENWVPGPNGTTQCYGTLLIPVNCHSRVLLTLNGRRQWFDVTKNQK